LEAGAGTMTVRLPKFASTDCQAVEFAAADLEAQCGKREGEL
jgi:hypothetical protein